MAFFAAWIKRLQQVLGQHKDGANAPQTGFLPQSYAIREWSSLLIFLVALTTALIYFQILKPVDQIIYDRLTQANAVPARDDIIIVAIDDYSLNELGKWPWPRDLHAKLIEQLTLAQPLVIGMDILFEERERHQSGTQEQGDLALAAALKKNGRTVLPLVVENTGVGLRPAAPAPLFEAAALDLGHIHLELDKDGVARSVFLREGMHGKWWPHFALALLEQGKKSSVTASSQSPKPQANLALPGARAAPESTNTDTPSNLTAHAGVWQRDYQFHIPYYGGTGHFTSVPYVAVLRGEVPAAFFKDKYVIVGPTALGMADSYATPVSSEDGALSGVEINANILASLLDGRNVGFASTLQTTFFSLLVICLCLISYLLLSPRYALLTTLGLFLSVALACFFALRLGTWFPPAAALLALGLAYPLWSWRRLEAALQFLAAEFILLDREPHLLPELQNDERETGGSKNPTWQDKLERSFSAMHAAARRVRDLRQFVSDSLSSLPDATLVTSVEGTVILANPAAQTYFKSIGQPQLQDAMLPYLFAGMNDPMTLSHTNIQGFSWWHLIDLDHVELLSEGIEIADKLERDLLIKSAPCYSARRELIGWILSIADISEMRQAERRRDENLRFISHDMRAPQASILALLELQQHADTALPQEEFLARIAKASRVTLGLADNFVHLAQAESAHYRLEEVNFCDIVLDATEEMWALAKAKNIRIQTDLPSDDQAVKVDRGLMTRALTNLLSNAIKYSHAGGEVRCELRREDGIIDSVLHCHIIDEGIGIPYVHQSKLFQRFYRVAGTNKGQTQSKIDGIGLGLVFVKTVIERHQGEISFTSTPGRGTQFLIKLPLVRLM